VSRARARFEAALTLAREVAKNPHVRPDDQRAARHLAGEMLSLESIVLELIDTVEHEATAMTSSLGARVRKYGRSPRPICEVP
jgi:hypothetical protein